MIRLRQIEISCYKLSLQRQEAQKLWPNIIQKKIIFTITYKTKKFQMKYWKDFENIHLQHFSLLINIY